MKKLFRVRWIVWSVLLIVIACARPLTPVSKTTIIRSTKPAPDAFVKRPKDMANSFQPLVQRMNYWRKQVNAPPLSWSPHLAEYARQWAKELQAKGGRLRHREICDYGEILAVTSGFSMTPSEVVDYWANERSDYSYETNSCRNVCGHYTQIVWAGSREVGCAVETVGKTHIWVCYFDPPGNYVGVRPY